MRQIKPPPNSQGAKLVFIKMMQLANVCPKIALNLSNVKKTKLWINQIVHVLQRRSNLKMVKNSMKKETKQNLVSRIVKRMVLNQKP